MPDFLIEGIKFFNAGRYFEAHEAWEETWRQEATAKRIFYQALVQAAVGMHHLSRRNLVGARAQLSKSLSKLDGLPAEVDEIDVETFRVDLRKVLDHLQVGTAEAMPIVRLKSKRLVVESERTR